ncbi:MAG: ferrous iron transport protein B [Leptospiraceae bacterium]|nr:ferrous iron transport protein B [Leptospiraceae bacterium]MDW8306104.1 ferrous iron transport protein B [Leptospiraceae bacterium]
MGQYPVKIAHIALVGNPNSGKSTLFNALCGARQYIANYPGSTVEKKSGIFFCAGREILLSDLPGSYSLKAYSPEEGVTARTLLGKEADFLSIDLVLYLADVTTLKRSLYLYTQLAQLSYPTVLVLTMKDLAQKKGLRVQTDLLASRLGIPVLYVDLRDQEDLQRLKKEICHYVENPPPPARINFPPDIEKKLKSRGFHKQAVDFALFDEILGNQAAASLRYHIIEEKLRGVYLQERKESQSYSDKLDKIVTHPVWGLGVFALVMFFIFEAIYFWAKPLMELIEFTFGTFAHFAAAPLAKVPILHSLVIDGLIQGVGSVLVFVPQIVFLFFFLGLLEESGYLARAAFLMDKLLGWSGLNGKAFVPLLSSFACAIPGVLATRTIAEHRERVITILIAPLMSCSSRLPLYWVLISAFVEPFYGKFAAALAFVAIHALGPLVALPMAYLFSKSLFRKEGSSFLLELPDYRLPQWKNIYYKVKTAALKFITTAGSVILVFSLVIWFFSYFPKIKKEDALYQSWYMKTLKEMPEGLKESEKERFLAIKEKAFALEQSFLGRMGRAVEPLFAPLGFDWKISVAVLAAFPARELIISTLGILYQVGEDADEETALSLAEKLPRTKKEDGFAFNPAVAISLLVFFALSAQCMSTLAVVKKELISWRWPLFLFIYMTALAYVLAFLAYRLALYFLGN